MNHLLVPEIDLSLEDSGLSGWLLLTIDGLLLALPQKDVKLIELFSALQVAVEGEAEAGWYRNDNELWPSYCLDHRLILQSRTPKNRRFCIFLEVSGKTTGILCDMVKLLPSDEDLKVQTMPDCITEGSSPILWISLFNEGVVVVTRAIALASYLSRLEKDYAETE